MKFILNTMYTVRWIFKGETYYTRLQEQVCAPTELTEYEV